MARTITEEAFSAIGTGKNPLGKVPIVALTANTTLNEATHAGKLMTLDAAAGFTITVPAATGTGNIYRFFVLTTTTSNQYRWSVTGTAFFYGWALADDGDGEPANGWTTGTNTNQVNLGGTSNATGGVKGDWVEIIDVGTNAWAIKVFCTQGGTEATPFANV